MNRSFQIIITLVFFGFNHGEASALENSTVQMGVCEHRAIPQLRCVMSPSDCHSDEEFLTIHQQRLQNKQIDCPCEEAPTFICYTSTPGGEHLCVSDPSYCDTANGDILGTAEESEDQCSCALQYVEENGYNDDVVITYPAYYGACRIASKPEHFFCAFQPGDCEGPYEWVLPKDTLKMIGTECTCDKVRTGGCYSEQSGVTCSTSEAVCGDGRFFGPVSLKERYGESCRLCSEEVGRIFSSSSSNADMIDTRSVPPRNDYYRVDLLSRKEGGSISVLSAMIGVIFIMNEFSRLIRRRQITK